MAAKWKLWSVTAGRRHVVPIIHPGAALHYRARNATATQTSTQANT